MTAFNLLRPAPTATATPPNLVSGTGGNHTFTGTAATDTLNYGTLASTQVRYTQTNAGWTVHYANSSTTGTDTLSGIERLAFADKTIALDGLNLESTTGTVLAVYAAAFNALPNAATLGYWMAQQPSPTPDSTPLARLTTAAQIGLDDYVPKGVSNEALVKQLYKNLFGCNADADTVHTFSAKIEAGTLSQASLVALAAEQFLMRSDYVELVGQGVAYVPFEG